MNMWWEPNSLIEGLSLNDEEDQILWNFTTNGVYDVKSLYAESCSYVCKFYLEIADYTTSSFLLMVAVQ